MTSKPTTEQTRRDDDPDARDTHRARQRKGLQAPMAHCGAVREQEPVIDQHTIRCNALASRDGLVQLCTYMYTQPCRCKLRCPHCARLALHGGRGSVSLYITCGLLAVSSYSYKIATDAGTYRASPSAPTPLALPSMTTRMCRCTVPRAQQAAQL